MEEEQLQKYKRTIKFFFLPANFDRLLLPISREERHLSWNNTNDKLAIVETVIYRYTCKDWEEMGGEGYSREIISSCFKSGPLGDALPSLRPLSYFIFPFHFPFVPSTLPIPPSLRFFSILFLFLLSAPSPLLPFFYYFFSLATFDSEISLLILTAGVFIFELSETGETVTVRNRVSKSRLIFRSICQLGGYLPSLLLEVRTNLEGEKEGEI